MVAASWRMIEHALGPDRVVEHIHLISSVGSVALTDHPLALSYIPRACCDALTQIDPAGPPCRDFRGIPLPIVQRAVGRTSGIRGHHENA